MTTVILQRVKYPHNLAAAIRACACFGVDELFYTGSRFEFKEGERLPREERMKGYSSVKWEATETPFDRLKRNTRIICVELTPSAYSLKQMMYARGFPKDVAFVFGPEDGHVSQSFRGLCHEFLYIPAKHCLNLAAAINVVLADYSMKMDFDFKPADTEKRGQIDIPGWEGK